MYYNIVYFFHQNDKRPKHMYGIIIRFASSTTVATLRFSSVWKERPNECTFTRSYFVNNTRTSHVFFQIERECR
jgi:hypothetical protein